jgi:O-antigen ligase
MMRFERIAIAAWTVLLMSASLTVVIEYLHWFATAALLPLLVYTSRRSQKDFHIPRTLLIAAAVLVLSMFSVSLTSDNIIHDTGQSAKVACILLVVLPMVVKTRARRDALWAGAEAAVYLNVLLIVGGLTVSPVLFGLQSFARFGTYTTPPGSLWQVGAIGLAAAGLLEPQGRSSIRVRRAVCAVFSIVFIALDGSRTGFLALTFATLLYTPRFLRWLLQSPLRALLIAVPLAILAAFLWPSLDEFFSNYGVVRRLQHSADDAVGDSVSAAALDGTRTAMYLTVIDAIRDHPIVGTGLNSTVVKNEAGDQMIHCSFLEVWADVGLLGFVAFSVLTAAPLLATLQSNLHPNPESRKARLQLFFLFGGRLLVGFIFAFSTELTEWIWFILLIAVLGNCHHARRPERKCPPTVPDGSMWSQPLCT